jgi:hypothetical protein
MKAGSHVFEKLVTYILSNDRMIPGSAIHRRAPSTQTADTWLAGWLAGCLSVFGERAVTRLGHCRSQSRRTTGPWHRFVNSSWTPASVRLADWSSWQTHTRSWPHSRDCEWFTYVFRDWEHFICCFDWFLPCDRDIRKADCDAYSLTHEQFSTGMPSIQKIISAEPEIFRHNEWLRSVVAWNWRVTSAHRLRRLFDAARRNPSNSWQGMTVCI